MAKRGRTPLLDEVKRREICAILAVGSNRKVAAKYVGCSLETIRRTAERDATFYDQLRRAESQHEVTYLQCILTASSKDWRAAAWALERTYPDRFAARKPHCVTAEQVSELLTQFAEILVEHIPDKTLCETILDHLQRQLEIFREQPARAATPAVK